HITTYPLTLELLDISFSFDAASQAFDLCLDYERTALGAVEEQDEGKSSVQVVFTVVPAEWKRGGGPVGATPMPWLILECTDFNFGQHPRIMDFDVTLFVAAAQAQASSKSAIDSRDQAIVPVPLGHCTAFSLSSEAPVWGDVAKLPEDLNKSVRIRNVSRLEQHFAICLARAKGSNDPVLTPIVVFDRIPDQQDLTVSVRGSPLQ
ncbi:hypothetical protein EUX98_g6699, partial [Antrodiella citrinella]